MGWHILRKDRNFCGTKKFSNTVMQIKLLIANIHKSFLQPQKGLKRPFILKSERAYFQKKDNK